jgi:hypothetical protein
MDSTEPDISVHAAGEANSAGTKAAGADVESGNPDVQKRAAPALSDAVEVSVDCKGEHVGTAEAVLREVGATHTWTR